MPPDRPWITTEEAADLIGVTTARIRQICNDTPEALKAVKAGANAWVIDRKAAEAMAANPASVGRPRSRPKPAKKKSKKS